MIEIKNLDFAYKKQVVFNNISLSFEKGNIYGLLGENGVGKTTLLKLISGLQQPNVGSAPSTASTLSSGCLRLCRRCISFRKTSPFRKARPKRM